MPGRLQYQIALGVIALFALLAAGGAAFVGKTKKDKGIRDRLPAAHRQMLALPLGAERSVAAPHIYWGPCQSCHPVMNSAYATPAMARSLPRRTSQPNAYLPAWMFRTPAGGAWQRGGGATPQAVAPARRVPSANTGTAPFSTLEAVAAPTGLLTPLQQNAANKIMVEGHWMGMETLDLTPSLRGIYKIPSDISGVIVDEITLESAESGILAGDVITSIQGRPTRNLEEFFQATVAVSERERAEVVVYRMGAERRFILAARNAPTLGFAQMEGAQPIRPGALSPHRQRNRACTDCHVIMATGGQLPVDAGDVLPTPPPISANAGAIHEYRGECRSCHVIR